MHALPLCCARCPCDACSVPVTARLPVLHSLPAHLPALRPLSLPPRRKRPTFEEVDRELVRIEMEFRLHRHRAASKRASSAGAAGGGSQGAGSLPASRPASPDVAPRVGDAAADQAAAS